MRLGHKGKIIEVGYAREGERYLRHSVSFNAVEAIPAYRKDLYEEIEKVLGIALGRIEKLIDEKNEHTHRDDSAQ